MGYGYHSCSVADGRLVRSRLRDNLKRLMGDMSQSELAKDANVKAPTINAVLTGKRGLR
jgi:plasmid maintenance system antidote protein VapI